MTLHDDVMKLDRAVAELRRVLAVEFLKVVNRLLAWLLRRI